MSSQPAKGPASKKRREPFERWRKVMLAGALILLANALGNALIDGQLPQWTSLILNLLGYVLLAAGFAIRMRDIKAAKEQGAAKDKEGAQERPS